MSEIVDQKIGSAGEVKVDQSAGVLSVEVDISQPISISGIGIGSVTGKAVLQINEISVVELLASKYPAAKAVLDFLKAEIQPAPAAPAPAAAPQA